MVSVKGLPFNSSTDRLIYHVGPSGVEVIVFSDGEIRCPQLTGAERKEFEMLVRVDKLFVKAEKLNLQDSIPFLRSVPDPVYFLKGIPDAVGLDRLSVWKEITDRKMTPDQMVSYLLELYRLYQLGYRG